MIIYELVVDNDETWYSLGLFESLQDAVAISTARDGIDGQSVSEGGDEGEVLFIRQRVIGNFDCCGDIGIDVVRIKREPTYQESSDSYPFWVSEIIALPNAKDHRAEGSGASPCWANSEHTKEIK
jgi:hypothetical protein